MKNRRTPWLAPLIGALFAACGHGDPSSTPIAPVSFDAVFVVNGGSGSIAVINAATGQAAGTIVLKNAEYPHHLYLSPDRSTLAVAVPGVDLSGGHSGHGSGHATSGVVMLLDALTGSTRTTRRLEAPCHNVIYSPDGKEVWTAQMTSPGTVLVLDPATLATRQTIPVGDMPAEVTFSKDGKYAFVANGMSANVTVIDAATKQVTKTLPVGKNPVGAWPGDDNVMYVDNEEGQSLSAIDVATLAVLRTYNLGFTPAMARTAPGGALWVTDTDNGKLVFYMANSDTKTGEVAAGAAAHAIAFSADAKTAYVTNQGAASVSVVDVATRTVTGAILVGDKPNGLVFRARANGATSHGPGR